MAKVTVILPNYNHAKFLKKRIESVLYQSFTDFEIIILDDCSTDNSKNILDSFKNNPKVKEIVFNTANSGSTFKQWETGLQKAKSEFIWIAESDDLADKDFLAKHIANFKKNPDVGVSFSASTWIDEKGEEIHQPQHEVALEKKGVEVLQNEFIKGNLIYNASSCVFKKELVPWDTLAKASTYQYCGDWLFWADLVVKTTISRLPERLNYFRRHQNNVSFKAESKGLQFSEGLKVFNHILNLQTFSFFKKQYLTLYWVKKLVDSELENKKSYLVLLPVSAKPAFAILSIFRPALN